MSRAIPGLHHVTAISGPPQANVDFYVGTMRQRLVKRTVNFDAPDTYHLYYGDRTGAPLNRELQCDGRVLPFPFHFLDNNQAMNVCPRHYDWPEFCDHLVDLTGYAFSWPRIYRRLRSNRTPIPKWLNVVRVRYPLKGSAV
jgi:catechol 2,3-dioxygenase-like lactoylglutathione lyase family enzyme